MTDQEQQHLVSPLKLTAALLMSAGILFYYFYGQDWQAIIDATQGANLVLAGSCAFILVLNNWFFEVYIRGTHFQWFHKDMQDGFPWKDYFWMRGALYLVTVINGPLSGGARLLYLVKKTGISWTLFFGIGLFRIILRAGAIALVMLAFSWLLIERELLTQSGIPLFYWFAFILWNLFVFIDCYLAFFHKRYVGLSRFFSNRFDHQFFLPLREAGLYQWLWTILVGSIPIVIFIVAYWLMARAFGIEIPFWFFSITLIFVLLLSNLPIAFGGLGTTTMAWMLFYENYAGENLILAFSVFLPVARMLVHAMIGMICLKPALHDFFDLLREAQEADSDKEEAKKDISSLFFHDK